MAESQETSENIEGSGWLTEQLRERGNAVMKRLFEQESFPGQGWPYDKSCPAPPSQKIPPVSVKDKP